MSVVDTPGPGATEAPLPTESAERAEHKGTIARRAGIVAAGTFLSRFLGAIRDPVIAAHFPLQATDMFFVALTIPNALRNILAEGAVSAAVVPVFTQIRAQEGEERAREYYANLRGVMLVVLILASILGIVFAGPLVHLYAEGYAQNPDKFALTVKLTQVMFPYLFFMGIAALGMGALNSLGKFAVPAVAPALWNVALIAAPFCLIPFAQKLGLSAIGSLAIATLIGGVLQVIAQWPVLRSVRLLTMPRFNLRDPAISKTFKLLLPLVVSLGVYQLNVIMGRRLASFLPEGSQSYLWYGQRLIEIPQGMFALAIASATLPTLSGLYSRGDMKQMKEVFGYSMRLTSFVSIPASFALAALSEPIVTVLFGRNHFGLESVHQTARSLVWQASGIWAVAAVRNVVPMFYAFNDTKTPVVCSAANLVVFVAISLLLMKPMGHVGIAIALSVAAAAQLFLLLFFLRRRAGRLHLGSVAKSGVKALIASLAMSAVGMGVATFGHYERGGNDFGNIVIVAVSCLLAGCTYLVVAYLLKSPELGEILRRRRRAPA